MMGAVDGVEEGVWGGGADRVGVTDTRVCRGAEVPCNNGEVDSEGRGAEALATRGGHGNVRGPPDLTAHAGVTGGR